MVSGVFFHPYGCSREHNRPCLVEFVSWDPLSSGGLTLGHGCLYQVTPKQAGGKLACVYTQAHSTCTHKLWSWRQCESLLCLWRECIIDVLARVLCDTTQRASCGEDTEVQAPACVCLLDTQARALGLDACWLPAFHVTTVTAAMVSTGL